MCVFVVLGIWYAMRLGGVILSSVGCPTVQYFPTLSHKRHDLQNMLLNSNLCFDFYISI